MAGHEVTTADDGETALLLLKENDFDCTPRHASSRNAGYRSKGGVRQVEQSVSLRSNFFAVTADVSPRQRNIYWGAGFRGVVEKPFESDDIFAAFSEAQRSSRRRTVNGGYPPDIDAARMGKLERSLAKDDFIEGVYCRPAFH
jgi:DNA-binding response OmpR family regulator